MAILLDAEGLSASRPGRPLFRDLSLTVSDGDRIGFVGLNGCGKSTLLRLLAGGDEPDGGEVRRGRGVRVGVLDQAPVLHGDTVRDAAGGGWQVEAVLDKLGMGAMLDRPIGQLSGGQAKRVALARLLAGDDEVLVLDEPTNHLDLEATEFLEQHLRARPGGLLLVSHDRTVLDAVTTRVVEIDRGAVYVHAPERSTDGSGYSAYLADRIEREGRAAGAEQVRRQAAKRELAWLRRGAPARSTKPKARVAAATALVNTRPQAAARSGPLDLSIGTRRLGAKAVELHAVAFRWPEADRDLLVPLDMVIEPGDRWGIVGPNGAGKSTLLDLIAGRLQPTSGVIERGSTVHVGYYDQLGRTLDLTQRVRDAVAGPHHSEPGDEARQLMQRFWFDGDAQFAPIGMLSGGERRRLQLLLTLVEQPNVLLLDEPTNDLDLDTLRALEDFLETWKGAVVTVSHDRTFLTRVVSDVLALDGTGAAREVRGGVAGWMAERDRRRQEARAPAPAARAVRSAARPSSSGPSPSTLRRRLAAAERDLTAATTRRDELAAAVQAATDHGELAHLTTELAAADAAVATAEERWLESAAETEAAGLTVD